VPLSSYDIDMQIWTWEYCVVQKIRLVFQNNYKRMDMRWGRNYAITEAMVHAIEEYKLMLYIT